MTDTQYFLGGGPAILAVCAAATTISPNYKIFPMLAGGISLWILSVIYLAIDLATLPLNSPELYIAHLAGALMGFLFILLLRKGIDGSEWMNNLYDWVTNIFSTRKNRNIVENRSSQHFFIMQQRLLFQKRLNLLSKNWMKF
ncbi:rhomboid family intramembrane serine protease [Niabella hibiscisoli]|uniref:rhomboid family intramembrane serine protease n=1 Tax=Niabella hibiscisoli TaxID=1825928 RepID=UPI0021D41FE5|nr:rhomboid family intramembrane serine protease [Niabella hibiscisoli]